MWFIRFMQVHVYCQQLCTHSMHARTSANRHRVATQLVLIYVYDNYQQHGNERVIDRRYHPQRYISRISESFYKLSDQQVIILAGAGANY
mmetsp:Transcript_10545/g.17086  ORF Transcript_10545/g.17086 Transcript_10545/m.17086 type:complete len:90 (-) Transcript_10545:325-594(-)